MKHPPSTLDTDLGKTNGLPMSAPQGQLRSGGASEPRQMQRIYSGCPSQRVVNCDLGDCVLKCSVHNVVASIYIYVFYIYIYVYIYVKFQVLSVFKTNVPHLCYLSKENSSDFNHLISII